MNSNQPFDKACEGKPLCGPILPQLSSEGADSILLLSKPNSRASWQHCTHLCCSALLRRGWVCTSPAVRSLLCSSHLSRKLKAEQTCKELETLVPREPLGWRDEPGTCWFGAKTGLKLMESFENKGGKL